MGKFIFLFFLFCVTPFAVEANTMCLKEKLGEANPGSYLVIEQNKTFTFLHIYNRTESAVVIEEVSIPSSRYAQNPMNWKQWFENGAPGHTSWMISQVNLYTGQFEEAFSYTHQGWIDMSDSNPFLTTLLNLAFHEVPEAQRRRIGTPPGYNKQDHRPIWNPRLIVDGQIIRHTPFIAWKARWPADGTELSRKIIEVYLPVEQSMAYYPTYFPYWLEVDGKIGSAKVRVIDSGMQAISPREGLPKRPPQLMGEGKLQEKGLTFYLKSPSYFREFMIFAEENNSFFGQIFPLPCETEAYDQETVSLFIPKEELEKWTTPGQSYRFTITPKEDPSIILETHTSLSL